MAQRLNGMMTAGDGSPAGALPGRRRRRRAPGVPLGAADHEAWCAYPRLRALQPGRYVCVHPGARAGPAAHFAAVADAIARETGLPIVLTGSSRETDITRAVAAAMREPALDAAAAVPVGALAALLAGASLLVGNDTGTSHIAAALRLPSVIVFRASEIERWAPADAQRHRAVWDPDGTRVDEVLRQARALLAAVPSRR